MPLRIRIPANALEQLLARSRLSSGGSAARPASQALPSFPPAQFSVRTFAQTSLLSKKGGSSAKKAVDVASKAANNYKTKPALLEQEAENPHDFSTLEAAIENAQDKLSKDLEALRNRRQIGPDLLENLRISLEKDSKETYRLGDLAQVLPQGGRKLMILVGEKEHVKHIISTIHHSDRLENIQPQQDAHNQLQLNMNLPPPTKESRDAAIADAKKAGETALTNIRNARAANQKRLRNMEIKKLALPDELKKAHKDMDNIIKKADLDAKKTVEHAQKAMEKA